MIYLIIDTETNGLPQSYELPMTDTTNWPRLISAAWGLFDGQGRELSRYYSLVKPDGYRWNRVAQQIHQITPEQAAAEGRPVAEVLTQLQLAIEQANAWVGHNIDLDYGVIGAEFVRAGRTSEFLPKPVLCTMNASAIVNPNREPVRLDDLYKLLTGRRMKDLHNAVADMEATARCFFLLKAQGLFSDPR